MPTRRRFLFNCSAIAAAASLSPARLLSSPDRHTEVPLHQITFQDFAANVRTPFHVRTKSGRSVELQLAKAVLQASSNTAGKAAGDASNEKFSLLFTAPPGALLPQDSCVFEHKHLGRFRMFVSPVGPRQMDVCHYEACFNRPAPQKAG